MMGILGFAMGVNIFALCVGILTIASLVRTSVRERRYRAFTNFIIRNGSQVDYIRSLQNYSESKSGDWDFRSMIVRESFMI